MPGRKFRVARWLGCCVALTLIAGRIEAKVPKVLAVDGEAVIYDTPGGTVVAVDASNFGTPLDGIVDYVFIAQRETKGAAAPRRSNVHIEFWGDSFRVLEIDRRQAIDFALADTESKLRALSPDWGPREARDAFGISVNDVRAEKVPLVQVAAREGVDGEALRKAYEPWYWDPAPNPGGGSNACDSGGPGSTSCSHTCGYGSLQSTCSVSCGRGTHACCRCDYLKASCTCVPD